MISGEDVGLDDVFTYSGSMTFCGLGSCSLHGGEAAGLSTATDTFARVAVDPPEFCAMHWYQAESELVACRISSVEAPPSVWMMCVGDERI